MSTYTFEKRAGDPMMRSTEDPAMALLGDAVPDWVKLPHEMGGGRRAVLGHDVVDCPCGGRHRARELSLGDRLYVAECPLRGFLWYRRPGIGE